MPWTTPGGPLAVHQCLCVGLDVWKIEYRLAPENPDPAPVEDCYAGLEWFTRNAAEFGFDPNRVLVIGGSAGGGLAAGVTLLARDRQGPWIAWQFLSCPMLDDRDQTISARQIVDGVPWARDSNRFGGQSLLGKRCGTDDVSIYAAPARATDLTGLPSTYLDVGDAEVFPDEVVAFACKLWAAGINCELHVWAGGFHGFGMIYSAQVSVQAARSLSLGFEEVDATMWDRMVAVNLTGVYNGISTFYADLIGAGDAPIVNTASIGGLLGTARLAPYSATKTAVIALSEALRDEFAQAGVGVSVLCPGPVRSRLWRTSRSLRGLPDTDTPPTDLSGQSAHADMLPAEVGDLVIRGIHDNPPYIMTHDFSVILDVRDRALREAFTGTRTLDLPRSTSSTDAPP